MPAWLDDSRRPAGDAARLAWVSDPADKLGQHRKYLPFAFTEQGVQAVSISTSVIYRELLKQIVRFFETKKAPLDIAVTVEIVAFIEAAWKSAHNHGTGEKVTV